MNNSKAIYTSVRNIENSIPVTERRRFIRHPLCFPLTYKLIEKKSPDHQKEKRSTTINISMGGLLFAAKRAVKIGSTIIVNLGFQDKKFNVRSRVVYCGKNKETNLYNIGVKFYRLHDAFKVKLIEQLYLISEFRDLQSMKLGREISLEDASREWIKRYSDRFSRLYW